MIEIYMDTPWYVPQPHGVPIDLSLPTTRSSRKTTSIAAKPRALCRSTNGRLRSRAGSAGPDAIIPVRFYRAEPGPWRGYASPQSLTANAGRPDVRETLSGGSACATYARPGCCQSRGPPSAA